MEEAVIGGRGEKLLVHLINSNQGFAEKIAKCLQARLGFSVCGVLRAEEAPQAHKSDIIISDAARNRIGLSLKTRKPGRPDDHLDRRWLDKLGRCSQSWEASLNMPTAVYEAFRRGIVRKAVDKTANLIYEKDRPLIEEFLLSRLDTFLEEVFRRGEEHLKLFAIIEYEKEKKLYVFKMEDIIELVKRDILSFGLKFGGVIYLGNFLWIQRKAGDGKKVDKRIPKTDPRHPGNQLQVKILPIPLKNEAVKSLNYCEFEISFELTTPKRGRG